MALNNAMSVSVSGLKAAENELEVVTANIGGSRVNGFKRLYSAIQAQAASNAAPKAFSGGAYVSVNGRNVDLEGALISAPVYSNLGISGGNGMFVVNTSFDGTGETQFTRNGDFSVDNHGLLVNSAGKFLRAWALDDEGRRPGQPGNIDVTAATDFQSLGMVDLKRIATQASPTTALKMKGVLPAQALPIKGPGQKIDITSNSSTANFAIGAADVFIPDSSLKQGDDLVVTTPNGGVSTFTYGGISVGNNISTAIFGASTEKQAFSTTSGAIAGDSFTIKTSSGTEATFTFVTTTPRSDEGKQNYEFNTLAQLATALTATKFLAARVYAGRLHIAPVKGNEGLTVTDSRVGGFASALGISNIAEAGGGQTRFATMNALADYINNTGTLGATIASSGKYATLDIFNKDPLQTISFGSRINETGVQFGLVDYVTSKAPATTAVLGVSTLGDTFTSGVTDSNNFTIQAAGDSAVTFTYKTTPTLATEFNSMDGLRDAINSTTGTSGFSASFVGGALRVKPTREGASLTFANTVGTLVEDLGFANSSNILGASTAAGKLINVPIDDLSSLAPASLAIFGASSTTTAFTAGPDLVDGDQFTIEATNGALATFTYKTIPAAPTDFDSLETLKDAINTTTGTSDVSASIVNGALRLHPTTAGDTLVVNDLLTSTIAATLSFTSASDGISIAVGSDTPVVFTYKDTPDTLAGEFNSLETLATAINSANYQFSAYVEGGKLMVKPYNPGNKLTFANTAFENGLGTDFKTLLGLSNTALTYDMLDAFRVTTAATGPSYDPSGDVAGNFASKDTNKVNTSQSDTFQVYDSLGTAHSFKIQFGNLGPNLWAVEVYANEDNDIITARPNDNQVAYGTLTFDGKGKLFQVSGTIAQPITIYWKGSGAAATTLNLDFGKVGDANSGMSQINTGVDGIKDFQIDNNGSPSSDISNFNIDQFGVLSAIYKNGMKKQWYQIPLATAQDPNSMTATNGTAFVASQAAGNISLKVAGAPGVGNINSAFLEQSNVDMSEELTKMISIQSYYTANANAVGAASKLLERLNHLFS